jgi:TatA/E family protein of Tat protein translocase
MFNIGPLELLVILLLALVVVGPSRLPEVGRSIGKGLRELRKVQDEMRDSINFNLDEPIRPKPVPRKPRTPERTPPAPADDDPGWAAPAAAETVPEAPDLSSEGPPHAIEAPAGEQEVPGDPADPAAPAAGSPNGSTPPETPQE